MSAPHRNASGLRPIAQRDSLEETQRKALQQAARKGWSDVAAGRHADVGDADLEGFIGQLGMRAARQDCAGR